MPEGAVTLRPARVADAQAIATINVAGWNHAYAHILDPAILKARSVEKATERWRDFLARTDDPITVIVAEGEDGLLGYGSAGPQRDVALGDAGYAGEVTALYVDPARYRGGIGTALMRALAGALIDAGHASASLWVLEGNARGRRFYERIGGTKLPQSKVEDRLGGVTELAYGWPDLALLASPYPIPEGEQA